MIVNDCLLIASLIRCSGRRRWRVGFGRCQTSPRVTRPSARAERQAVNTVIQGSAADLMKEAMIRTCAALSTRGMSTARLIAQVITCDCAGDYM